VGWHTFRRSIATWLIENEENVKVTQEILRHRHVGTTLDLYAKAVTQTKRQAQQKIVNQLLAAQKRNSEADDFECFGVVQ
jgi:integrase